MEENIRLKGKSIIFLVILAVMVSGCVSEKDVENQTKQELEEVKTLNAVREFSLIRKGAQYSVNIILLDQDNHENSFNGTLDLSVKSAGIEVYSIQDLAFHESAFSASTTIHFDGRPLESHLEGRFDLPGNFSRALCTKGIAQAKLKVENVSLSATSENVSTEIMNSEERQAYFETSFNETATRIGLSQKEGMFNVTIEKIGPFGVDCGFPEKKFAAYLSVKNLAEVPKPFYAGGVTLFTGNGLNYTGYEGVFSRDVIENVSGFVFFDAPRDSTPLMLRISQLIGEPIESHFEFNVSGFQ